MSVNLDRTLSCLQSFARQFHINRHSIAQFKPKEKFLLSLVFRLKEMNETNLKNELDKSSLAHSEVQPLVDELTKKIKDFANQQPAKVSHLWFLTFGRDCLLIEKQIEESVKSVPFAKPKNLPEALINLSHIESNLDLNHLDLLCETAEWIRQNFKQNDDPRNLVLLKRFWAVVGRLSQKKTDVERAIYQINYLKDFQQWTEKALLIGLPLHQLPPNDLEIKDREAYKLFRILFIDCHLANALIFYKHKIVLDKSKQLCFEFKDGPTVSVDQVIRTNFKWDSKKKQYCCKPGELCLEKGFESFDPRKGIVPIRRNMDKPLQNRVEVVVSFPKNISADSGHAYVRIYTTEGEFYVASETLEDLQEFVPGKRIVATYELDDEGLTQLFEKIENLQKSPGKSESHSFLTQNSAHYVKEIRDFIFYNLQGHRVISPIQYSISFFHKRIFRIRSLFLQIVVKGLVILEPSYKNSRVYKWLDKKFREFNPETDSNLPGSATYRDRFQNKKILLPIDIAVENSSYIFHFKEMFYSHERKAVEFLQSGLNQIDKTSTVQSLKTLFSSKKGDERKTKNEEENPPKDENPPADKEKKDNFPPPISQDGAISSTEPPLPPPLGSDISPPPLPSAPPPPLPNQSIPPPFNTPPFLPPPIPTEPIPTAPLPGNHKKMDFLSQLEEKRKKLNLEEAEVKEGEGTETRKITPKAPTRSLSSSSVPEDVFLKQGVLARRASLKDTVRPPKPNSNRKKANDLWNITPDESETKQNPKVEQPKNPNNESSTVDNMFDALINQVVNKGRREPEDSSEDEKEEEENNEWE